MRKLDVHIIWFIIGSLLGSLLDVHYNKTNKNGKHGVSSLLGTVMKIPSIPSPEKSWSAGPSERPGGRPQKQTTTISGKERGRQIHPNIQIYRYFCLVCLVVSSLLGSWSMGWNHKFTSSKPLKPQSFLMIQTWHMHTSLQVTHLYAWYDVCNHNDISPTSLRLWMSIVRDT